MNPLDLARVFRAMAEAGAAECEVIAREERAQHREWIAQTGSVFGHRKHCKIVQRLVEAGDPGAVISGRKHLLSPEVLQRELQALTKRGPALAKPEFSAAPAGATPDGLRARLGLVGGARR
jgi:hypothetical protein